MLYRSSSFLSYPYISSTNPSPLSNPRSLCTRRRFLAAGSALTASLLLRGCSAPSRSPKRVVLYTSADDTPARAVTAEFTAATGILVALVGDTEATKTTGLVERLLAESRSPAGDVWWSSEQLGTLRLAEAGVLAPYRSPEAAAWPAAMRASDDSWHAFAARARVIAWSTKRLTEPDVPRRLADFAAPAWKGRFGMARPQFGTTRSHLAALHARAGEPALRAWLTRLRENDLRLYDGNAAVVRAIAFGEIDAGLTDTDDAFAAQREKWPVGFVFERPDAAATTHMSAGTLLPSFGPLLIPNTVALIRGGPNPDAGRKLADFLLSERVERLLAASESRNRPVRPGLQPAEDWPGVHADELWTADAAALLKSSGPAATLADEVFR